MARVLGADSAAIVLNQDIYEISATAKHRLGTRVQRGDRVYRYGKAGAAMTSNAVACWSIYNQTIASSAVQAAAPAGQNFVLVTVGASEGIANDGVFAYDVLAGGTILPSQLEENKGCLVAIVISGNEAFKRIGKAIPGVQHLRMFESIGGLGESILVRTEEIEDDPFIDLPLLFSTRKVLGVLYE